MAAATHCIESTLTIPMSPPTGALRCPLLALSRRRHTYYFPIEISSAALAVCRRELADIDSVGIVGLVAHGYGTAAWCFLVVYVAPVLLIGLWRVSRNGVAAR